MSAVDECSDLRPAVQVKENALRRLFTPTLCIAAGTIISVAAVAGPARHSSEASPTMSAPIAGMHVVIPGETLHSIARLYGVHVSELAKANRLLPNATVRVGDSIIIPSNAKETSHVIPSPPPDNADAAPAAPEGRVKTAEPAGGLPSFGWPVRGRVIAGFGPRPNGRQNDGIDIAVPNGTPVKAAADGTVAYAGNELKGYGNLVLIWHNNGYVTAYAHAREILVKRGDRVKRGQVIATSGSNGGVNAPELHFEIRKGATPVDPAQFLNGV